MTMQPEERKALENTMKKWLKCTSAVESFRILHSAGIVDKKGRLTKPYRRAS